MTAETARASGIPEQGALHRGAGAVVDLVFPPRCAACGQRLLGGTQPLLCGNCQAQLAGEEMPRCARCAAAMSHDDDLEFCPHCHNLPLHFDRAWTLGSYAAELRDAVLRSKHARDEPLSQALAELLWQRRGAALAELNITAVVPIPMHWRRRLSRRTNSPEVLAEALARHLRAAYVGRGLRRRRATREQSYLDRDARRRNVRQAFTVGRRRPWDGAHVLLVDDILTTGATCSEAARMLKRAGAAQVSVVVIARSQNLMT